MDQMVINVLFQVRIVSKVNVDHIYFDQGQVVHMCMDKSYWNL